MCACGSGQAQRTIVCLQWYKALPPAVRAVLPPVIRQNGLPRVLFDIVLMLTTLLLAFVLPYYIVFPEKVASVYPRTHSRTCARHMRERGTRALQGAHGYMAPTCAEHAHRACAQDSDTSTEDSVQAFATVVFCTESAD